MTKLGKIWLSIKPNSLSKALFPRSSCHHKNQGQYEKQIDPCSRQNFFKKKGNC